MKRRLEKDYESYKKKLLVEYINSKEDQLLNESERSNLEAIFTAFVSNISRILDYLSDQEMEKLYYNLTMENDQNFYDWVHGKYHNLCEIKNNLSGEIFLSSALLIRDFYKGNLGNISKGGDYLAALSQILKKREEGEEYKKREGPFIPEIIVKNIDQDAIDLHTRLCKKVTSIDNLNLELLKKILRTTLSKTIVFMANLKDRKLEIPEQNFCYTGLQDDEKRSKVKFNFGFFDKNRQTEIFSPNPENAKLEKK